MAKLKSCSMVVMSRFGELGEVIYSEVEPLDCIVGNFFLSRPDFWMVVTRSVITGARASWVTGS